MIKVIWQGSLFSFCISILCILVGAYSLEHYAVKTAVTREKMNDFLRTLKFPLTIFYVNERSNIFTAYSSQSPEDYLVTGSLVRSNVLRFMILGFAATPIMALLIYLFD